MKFILILAAVYCTNSANPLECNLVKVKGTAFPSQEACIAALKQYAPSTERGEAAACVALQHPGQPI